MVTTLVAIATALKVLGIRKLLHWSIKIAVLIPIMGSLKNQVLLSNLLKLLNCKQTSSNLVGRNSFTHHILLLLSSFQSIISRALHNFTHNNTHNYTHGNARDTPSLCNRYSLCVLWICINYRNLQRLLTIPQSVHCILILKIMAHILLYLTLVMCWTSERELRHYTLGTLQFWMSCSTIKCCIIMS